MTWGHVAVGAVVFLSLSVLLTWGMARWLYIQKTLDERDAEAELERQRRTYREDNWRY